MRVMIAANTGMRTGYLAGRYPGKIGHLISPGDQRGPFDFCPYALDNGAFGKRGFDAARWIVLLEWAKLSGQDPLWLLVPDVVGDRKATLERWREYSPLARRYGWPLAFAVQDGMVPLDVPDEAEVIFVGGTTDWKWSTVAKWCSLARAVHVGRVNSYDRLWQCHDSGAVSIDGTGWMRGDQRQYRGLLAYLAETAGEKIRAVQGLLGEGHAVYIS